MDYFLKHYFLLYLRRRKRYLKKYNWLKVIALIMNQSVMTYFVCVCVFLYVYVNRNFKGIFSILQLYRDLYLSYIYMKEFQNLASSACILPLHLRRLIFLCYHYIQFWTS